MAYLKNWTDVQMFFMGTSWVAVSINNIKTRASREMTSRKNIKKILFKWGERCQALAWGGARYLPSLIALLNHYFYQSSFNFPVRNDSILILLIVVVVVVVVVVVNLYYYDKCKLYHLYMPFISNPTHTDRQDYANHKIPIYIVVCTMKFVSTYFQLNTAYMT